LAAASAGEAARTAAATSAISAISKEENPTGVVDACSIRPGADLPDTAAGAAAYFVQTFAAGIATAAKRAGTSVSIAAGASGSLGCGGRGAEYCGERADCSENHDARV
jgi:hypothetical protein